MMTTSTAAAAPTSRPPLNRLAPPVAPTDGALHAYTPLGPGNARIESGFWALRQARNGANAIRSGYDRLAEAGNFENLRIAAGTSQGEVKGMIFQDSDAYKWLEAVADEYGRTGESDLLDLQREVTALVAAAQDDDGYLNAVHSARYPKEERYSHLAWNHELYCYGHLFQAAVAQLRCTGDTALMDVAQKVIDNLLTVFGPDGKHQAGGHPEIEMALVEVYRATGRREALDLAKFFLDVRGTGATAGDAEPGPGYFSDSVPVREITTVQGHAVRALYLQSGITDVATETNDAELLAVSERVWRDAFATKSFVTGGMGSRWDWEAFGDPYELPTDRGYAETCAAIAAIQWSWRLLLATGKPVYADAIERLLFNAYLAGVSLHGDEYFYVNSLQLRSGAIADEGRSIAHGRRGWFDCACCPPNIMRTTASLDQYAAAASPDGLDLFQYAGGTFRSGSLAVTVETDFPLTGHVHVVVAEGEGAIGLRIPSWSATSSLTVNGVGVAAEDTPVAAGTMVHLHVHEGDTIELSLDESIRFVGAHQRIDASRGAVAIERGPIVYCLEETDQPQTGPAQAGQETADPARASGSDAASGPAGPGQAGLPGGAVDDAAVYPDRGAEATIRTDLLDGVVTIDVPGLAVSASADADAWPYPQIGSTAAAVTARPATWTAIPYYAWANRGPAPMRVWMADARLVDTFGAES